MERADRLVRARTEAGLTQAEVAARTGIHEAVIAIYEIGNGVPNDISYQQILTAIGTRPSVLLDKHREALRTVMTDHGIINPRVCGSVARGTDTGDSDLDLLVRFPPHASLIDQAKVEFAAEAVIGVDVDVISEGGLRLDRRDHQQILEEAVPL